VGIALGSVAAARSEGLGIVPIGGIRLHPQALIDLLGLPDHTLPGSRCGDWTRRCPVTS
jgi:FMN reductase [NAD(P)H]